MPDWSCVPPTLLGDPEFTRALMALRWSSMPQRRGPVVMSSKVAQFLQRGMFDPCPACGFGGHGDVQKLVSVLWSHALRAATGGSMAYREGVVHLTFKGQVGSVPYSKGFEDITKLIQQPGVEIQATDLAKEVIPSDQVQTEEQVGIDAAGEASIATDPLWGTEDPVMDAEGMRSIKREIDWQATQPKSPSRDKLVRDLKRAYGRMKGLYGKPRQMPTHVRRAYNAVRKRMDEAMKSIAAVLPPAAAHLKQSIVRRHVFCYRPVERIDWKINP